MNHPDDHVDAMRPYVFCVRQVFSSGKTSIATAFPVARYAKSNRLVFATAKHVLRPEHPVASITFQSFDIAGRPAHTRTFAETHACPFATYNHSDVGFITLDGLDDNRNPLIPNVRPPYDVIDPHRGAAEGTSLGWAGYPGEVARFLSKPQFCYHHGVVAAMVHGDRRLYIVDGHASKGMSGGPAWMHSDDSKRATIVGIVSEYRWGKVKEIPGYCVFEPTSPIVGRLTAIGSEQTDDVLHLFTHSLTMSNAAVSGVSS